MLIILFALSHETFQVRNKETLGMCYCDPSPTELSMYPGTLKE